jgi:hypothetical protein
MALSPSKQVLEEGERLGRLLKGVSSLDDAIARIGSPDRDTSTQEPVDGDVPRIVVWLNVSTMFALIAYIEPDGQFRITAEEKSIWA